MILPRFWEQAPNWDRSFEITYEFMTDVVQSRTKKEQRNALRLEPRKRVVFRTTASKDRYRALQRALAAGAAQGESWYLPEIPNAVLLDTAANAGQPVISATTSTAYWMVVGHPVVLHDGQRSELGIIESIAAGNLNLTSNLKAAWPVGTRLSPALTGRIAAELNGVSETDDLIDMEVVFDEDPGSQTRENPQAPAAPFNGREVLTRQPNRSEAVQNTYRSARKTLDYGQGRVAHFLPATFATMLRRLVFLNVTVAEADFLRHLFYRMRGQQGEFYMHTGQNDIVPAAQLVSGQTTMTVAGTELHDAYATDTVFKAVAVRLYNGTTLYRKIEGMEVISGNSRVTFTASWPSTILPSDIVSVSWMPAWRFASDFVTFEWLTDTTCQVALTVQTVEDLAGD